jgi:hypothetical protein
MSSASPTASAETFERPRWGEWPGRQGDPFDGGPFRGLPPPLPLAPALPGHAFARGFLAVLVMWVPLAILSAAQGLAIGNSPAESFLRDCMAYGRYLVAGPVLASAGILILPMLSLVVRHFLDAEMIWADQRPAYDALVTSTRRLVSSRWVDVAILIAAYAVTLQRSAALYPAGVSTWVAPLGPDGVAHLSLAGWWRMLVSQPLLSALVGVWLWRQIVWTRFLWCVTRFDLRLVAAHPDGLAGLGFVVVPVRFSSIVAFGFSAIGAGTIAHAVLVNGQLLGSFGYLVGAQAFGILLLLCSPLLILTPLLARVQAWGTFKYGRLAAEIGHHFQRRWLGIPVKSDALGVPDFSATTDLYSIASSVKAMQLTALDLRTVGIILVASLLPYIPVLLATRSVEDVLEFLLKTFR